MLNRVRELITRYNLLEQGDMVIVGVSGGPDSITLLHVLNLLQQEYSLSLHVAHFNHMFRGQEANEEAEFVWETANLMGIPCTVKAEDVPSFIKEHGLSAQEGARYLRYRFFAKLASELQATKIALGHHADDQAETVLLHLFRGSGAGGLAGISPKRGSVIRPLLTVTRQEIEAYCQEYGLPSRTDPSNFKTIYTRNKVRLELLPLLKQNYNPNVVQNLNNTAEILRVENDFLDKMTEETFKRLNRTSNSGIALDKIGYYQLHPAMQRRLLRYCYKRLIGQEGSLNFKYIREIELFLGQNQQDKKLGLPRGTVLKICGVTIIFSKPEAFKKTQGYEVKLGVPGQIVLPTGLRLEAKEFDLELARQKYGTAKNYEAYLDMELVALPLIIRTRRPGDLFRPLGLNGSKKKLKDFLIDLKIPLEERNTLPIVTDSAGQIIWVGGYRLDEGYKMTENTKQVLYLQLKNFSPVV